MKIRILIVVLVLFSLPIFAGCGAFVSDDDVKVATEKQGYSDVEIQKKHIFFVSWHGCGEDDDACFKVKAKNPKGQDVDILVCAGWPFKGVTIRTK